MARQESRKRKAKLVRALTLTSVMVLMAASRPASAGFEWTPPPAPPPQEQLAPPVAAAPAASVEAESLDGDNAPILDPFPLERDVMTPMAPPEEEFADNEAAAPSAPVPAPVTATPVIPFMKAPARVAPAPQNVFAPVPPPPAAKTVYETVDGFGRDIPLVLAMRQIVPPDYSYAFDPDINPGARISWNGGKPWNEVIEDAVRPGDMRVEIVGNTVRVRQTWDVAEDAMQTAAAAPKPVSAPSPMPLMQPPVATYPVPPMAAMPAPMQAEEIMPPQSYPRRVKPDMAMPQDDGAGFVMPDVSENVMPAPSDIYAPVPLTPAPPAAVAPSVNPAPVPLTPSMAAAPVMAPPGTVSSAAGPALLDPHSIGFWQAEQGASLKEVLGRWSSAAGVAMLWNSAYDYALPAPMRLHATFPDAVTQILMGYGAMDPRPVGRLHPNLPHGPSVLVVENYSAATN